MRTDTHGTWIQHTPISTYMQLVPNSKNPSLQITRVYMLTQNQFNFNVSPNRDTVQEVLKSDHFSSGMELTPLAIGHGL